MMHQMESQFMKEIQKIKDEMTKEKDSFQKDLKQMRDDTEYLAELRKKTEAEMKQFQ